MGQREANQTRRRLRGALAAAALTLLPVLSAPAFAQERVIALGNAAVSNVVLRPSTTITIQTDRPFANLVVGDMNIADVVPLSDRAFYIQGKANGVTNVSIFDGGDTLLGVVDTRVSVDMSDVAAAIRAAVPGSQVTVRNLNNRIHLSGLVRDAPDVARAIEIAQQFSNDPVINALSVSSSQQVSLEVRVLEARRTAGRDLGVNFRVSGGVPGPSTIGSRLSVNVDEDSGQLVSTYGQNAPRNSQGTPFGTLVAQVLETAGYRLDIIIDALEKKGLVRRLAQPNLTTVSGEKAEFHAGGEVPIQTVVTASNGSSGTQTDYRPYGVRLDFQPTVLDGDLINLRVMTEVSEIDTAVTVNGNPGFTSRKAQTVIELRDGQSFAMAGLLQTVNAKTIEQMPWLGNVPVLGALFRSTSFQKEESDLVVVVTPHLVRPARPGEELHSPLDATRPSNDVELFALGLLEVDKDMAKKIRTGAGITGPFGHILDLEGAGPYAVVKP
ncbi:type II and III secretion system protein family protein [Aurantimonas sp. MSK8Z-1]|uniref:type II and III secretion system protein family protein n=1 Tax=Mangrovibrevibacter kandeliae TaxID=2968473 RepID=UPI0021175D5F|nr:type II and III secretion system protein family protein [Aurantimonas sp. MSK8Z-1]MCW4116819.1 type II and III secretion system protein family protein [Aurantimonas sp. MSK8Z-1]